MTDTTAPSRRRTKIVATLGPATDPPETLQALIAAGADVLRINFSHAPPAAQRQRVEAARAAAAAAGREVAILADLAGPKLRIGEIEGGSVTLVNGQPFVLDTAPEAAPGNAHGVGVSYAGLVRDVEPGAVLLLDDGLIELSVKAIAGTRIECTVLAGGELASRKGLNLKGGGLSLGGIGERDRDDIHQAAALGVDYLAVSFPRSAEDMRVARRLLRAAGGHAALIAKIERSEAIARLDEIVETSDALLVARGDLGVEIGDAELPGLQKRIIHTALDYNRTVITATQMMQSMITSPVPTRAEVLDVANAVIDGTDAVMLSAETAVGRHPVKVVEAMCRICLGAERHCAALHRDSELKVQHGRLDQAIAMAALHTSRQVPIDAIVALTESGSTAQWLSRVGSATPIFALSPNLNSRRRMALYRNVFPVDYAPAANTMDEVASGAVAHLTAAGYLMPGHRVLITMGDQLGREGGTNTLRLVQIGGDGRPDPQAALSYR